MSKLYTEEQVKIAIKETIKSCLIWQNSSRSLTIRDVYDDVLPKLIPIELPSIEELEKKSVEYSTDTETKAFYKDCCWDFQNGAIWMRNKIKGGKDEN